jgi:hypothetical protein
MANSELENKYWDLSDEMINHLNKIFNAYKGDENVAGYKRLNDLIESGECSYQQMKRIKNFFDTYHGTTKETPYLLNGGTFMKQWVDECLSNARNDVKGKKKAMMDVGMGNQYQKDGGSRDMDSSGERLKKSDNGVSEMNILSKLMSTIYGNTKNLI